MPDISELLKDPATTVAVVGATDDPSKTGYQIYRNLKAKGFRVFAVNPGRETVDGDPAYPSVADLPEKPTIVDIVVPPARTLQVIRQCHELDLRNVWVQPGAEDDAVVDYLESNGFHHLTNTCIMVRSPAHT
jgi:predicted CoA-binding protein